MQITCVKKRGAPARPAVLLALATLLAALALSLAGGGGFIEKAYALTSGDWEYSVEGADQDAVATITGYTGTDAAVTLPATVGEEGVKVGSASFERGYTFTNLDCSEVTDLGDLSITHGNLASLNVENCATLKTLICSYNKLTELDITGCEALTYLDCRFNYLTDTEALDTWRDGDAEKGEIHPQYDKETGFAFGSSDKGAVILGWDGRSSTVVLPDKIGDQFVVEAYLSGCGIEVLDISKCYDLAYLDCSRNYIKDMTRILDWATVMGHESNLSPQFHESGFAYEVQDGPDGSGAYIYDYDYARSDGTIVVPASLDGLPVVSVSLYGVACENLDLTSCTDLKSFFSTNSIISSIDASGLTNLEDLYCDRSDVESLSIEGCTSLTSLSCAFNQLSNEAVQALKAKYANASVSPQFDGEGNYQLQINCQPLANFAKSFAVGQGASTFTAELDPGTEGPWHDENPLYTVANVNCWSVQSDNPDIVTATNMDGQKKKGREITLTPQSAGTAKVTIQYNYTGSEFSYHAEASYDVTVVENANVVESFSITSSDPVEFEYIKECPICTGMIKTHGSTCEIPYTVEGENPDDPLTYFEITTNSQVVKCVSQSGIEREGLLGLQAKKVGEDQNVTLSAGKATANMAVTVNEVTDFSGIAFTAVEGVVMPEGSERQPLEMFYLADEASDAFQNSLLSQYHGVEDLIKSVASDKADIVAVGEDGKSLKALKSGQATITLTDKFGKTVECKVTVSTTYAVKHLLQKANDPTTYVEGDSETLRGVAGDLTKAVAKEFAGFALSGEVPKKTIEANNATVVEIKYDRKEYTVTWDANGGEFGDQGSNKEDPVAFGAKPTAPTAPTRDGYVFAGWSPMIPDAMPAEPIKLTAQWVDENAESNIIVSAPESDSGKLSLSDDDANKVAAAVDQVITAVASGESVEGLTDGDIQKVKTVTDAASASGGTVTTLVIAEAKEANPSPRDASPINDKAAEDLGATATVAQYYDLSVNLIVRNDSTEVAVPLTKVGENLTFVLNVNPDVIKNQKVSVVYLHDGVAKLINPQSVDYAEGKVTFASNEYSLYAIVTSDKAPTPPSGGGSATAQKFQVTFESNGGSAVAAQEVESGATVTKPADPTREGYTFAGWFADEALTKAWDFATDKVTAKTTLYAKWTTQSIMFSDVDFNAWYGPAVTFVADSGLMRGYAGTDLFGVGKNLTRAELAVILNRHANPDGDAGYDDVMASTPNNTGMADVEAGVWYTGAANWAVANGVINGKENADGTRSFDPNGNVTFEEMVAMMVNLAVTPDEIAAADMSVLDKFVDVATISDWSRASLAWAAQAGIFNGYDEADGTYIRPLEQITRERAAAVLFNNYA
ncbi:InlB B-repeat-containing protein [Gordonibacter sp.]|uniref:InlB B-repeat-containing protein n=1 Tax=Gordonibacter sp. TaxID=1968902 RepID=UPI001F9A5AAC|nr:InlB B-repeat-containing protein [Gordonibacter sp.]HIW75931.1 InlB B-repeat-containing protein [Candidatus Gordonibacter avicola]